MAQIYRTTVHGYFNAPSFFRQTGETVAVGDSLFARANHSETLTPMPGKWFYTQDEADQAAINDLKQARDGIDSLIKEIGTPLPAVAAAHGQAAGRAHAEVAT